MKINNYLLIDDKENNNAKTYINKEYIVSYKIQKLKEKTILDNGEIIINNYSKEKINTYSLYISIINAPCVAEKYIINFKEYDEVINYLINNNLINNFIRINAREFSLSEEENTIIFFNPKNIIEISIQNETEYAFCNVESAFDKMQKKEKYEVKKELNVNNKVIINSNNELIQNFVILIELINTDLYVINHYIKNNQKIYFYTHEEANLYLKEINLI